MHVKLINYSSTKIAVTLSLLLLSFGPVRAQDLASEVPHDTLIKYGVYDGDRLPPSFHAGRRALLLDSMASHSVAVLFATPEKTRSNDITYEYHQDPDFYYLTGCWEPGSALVLSKDGIALANGQTVHEMLFVRDRNPAAETWTGYRLGPQGALSALHVASAYSIDSLPDLLTRILPNTQILYYNPHYGKPRELIRDTLLLSDTEARAIVHNNFPNLSILTTLHQLLARFRAVKTPEELRLMRKAISISNEAHNAVIRDARPGWYEYQIQAEAEDIFTKNGAEYTAYPCIVGSGPNSTILHYETNRRKTESGDFIEMDMGAEYHGYSADVTRSFPINGTFTPEQRKIYEIVLAAQDSGIKACVTGAPFRAAHFAAVKVITDGLLKLGIIYDSADYRRYFMHGTSHYLGLDVHDAGLYGPLEPGNVLTVEPGIYIPAGSPCDPKWWNIGCRIEDDILVTAHGPENLSSNSPRTIAALERLLSESRLQLHTKK